MESNVTPQIDEKVKKPKDKRKRTIYLIVIAAILLVVVGISSYIYVENSNLVNSYSDKVYPGAFVLDNDVSGFTEAEVRELLQTISNDIVANKVVVTVGDKTYEKSYLNLDATLNIEEIENEILAYGKENSFFTKLDLIKNPEERSYDIVLTHNDEKVNEFVASIAEEVKVAPENATINVGGGSVNVGAGIVGKALNVDELTNNINKSLEENNGVGNIELTATVEEVQPQVTEEALSKVNSKISFSTTYYPPGPSGENLEIAAANINNTLLMPGETFSCTDAIGPTTIENGFKEANTYVGGQVVKGVGGGVCQLASTVYNAELKAGILPTERMNHMMTVGYIPLGLDATLADNLIDLRFENPYDYPIVVVAYAGGGSVTVEFWSNENAKGGITYEPKSYVSGLYADTWLYGYDASGNMVYEQYIDNSTYQPFN